MELNIRDALRQIQSELARDLVDEVPEGWMSVQQWAEGAGKSASHLNNVLIQAVRRGLMERQPFRISMDKDCGVRKVWHYRVKP